MLTKPRVCKHLRWLTLLVFVLFVPTLAFAHPMGNFSVNHYSGLELKNDRILIRYFIDLAEIPTYQELQQGNISVAQDGPSTALDPKDPAIVRFIATRGIELSRGLAFTLDGKPLLLRMTSSGVIFPPGAGGLPTMKMGFVYEASYPAGALGKQVSLHYADNNYQGHSGWKEIIAVASAGTLIRSTAPSSDRSGELSNYPTDLLSSPPQMLDASLDVSLQALNAQPLAASPTPVQAISAKTSSTVTAAHSSTAAPAQRTLPVHPATAVISPTTEAIQPTLIAPPAIHMQANQQQTPRSKFTELITAQHLSAWFLFTAAIVAIGLGALHALEPGHGKTIVAAYLVGSRGTARHAFLLGLIVTLSHTAGVFALGAITLYASRYIVPEQLYPWLGVFSGITIAILGCYMFLRRWTGTATDHSHAPGSSQGHWFSRKQTLVGPDEPAQILLEEASTKRVSMTQLFTLGITGGIIPCPAALIVLLSAFALHRVALGFFLIVAFSVGLAAVLIGFGMLMVYARRFMTHLQIDGPLTKKWLPLASSAFIMILGAGLAIQAFATTHFDLHALSQEKLGPVLFVLGLGLLLGMRHSTDADHVVAISTIVSKQRSIRNAAFIGSVWGLGHTITIVIVGSLIILFGVSIPPRIGLSMEFSVALMLILLGILNLTGVMQRIMNYFTPASARPAAAVSAVASLRKTSRLPASLEDKVSTLGWYQCLRPLFIGLVHGLAGSAAVALLVLSTIHNPYWASVYLIIFGIGTMIGMMIMTAAIALPLTYAGDRFSNLSRYFGVASGLVSVCFGTFLVYQLGFLGGLFTNHPQWTPQ